MSERPLMLVTGGSRGIGAATVRLAARRGYDLCFCYRSAAGAADAIVAEAEAAGAKAVAIRADMGEEEGIAALFEAVDKRFGRLDALVNNAGVVGPILRLKDLSRADLVHVLDVNVIGAFMVAREAVRRMAVSAGGRGGAIVNLSSRAAQLGGSTIWVHYAASKAAIESMTVGLAGEVGEEGIRVNAVCPGLIDTEIHSAAGLADRLHTMAPSIPLRRIGTAEEVAETILWLISDKASYLTGTLLPVSGGR